MDAHVDASLAQCGQLRSAFHLDQRHLHPWMLRTESPEQRRQDHDGERRDVGHTELAPRTVGCLASMA